MTTRSSQRLTLGLVTVLLCAFVLAAVALGVATQRPVSAQAEIQEPVLTRYDKANETAVPFDGEVRSSQDGTDYGSSPRLLDFDDSGWPIQDMSPQTVLTTSRVGFWAPHGTVPADNRGYYFRYEFELEDVYQIVAMDLDFFYDDSTIVFLNGQEIYRSIRNNLSGAAATNPSIYQPVDFGGAEDYYVSVPGTNTCEAGCTTVTLPPVDPQNLSASPVADSPNALIEGTNVLMAMAWTTTNSDLGFDAEMVVTRDLDAPFPAPIVRQLPDQTNELADSISLQVPALTENDPNSLAFSATGLPPGLDLTSGGLIFGSPSTLGTYDITITVSDNKGTTPLEFQWTIENTPPTINDPGPQQTPVLNGVSLEILAEDPDGGDVQLTVSGLPTGMNFNPQEPGRAIISGASTVEGPYSVIVTATDDEGEDTVLQIPWQIAEPPIDIVNPGEQSTPWGQTVNLELQAIDPTDGNVALSIGSPLPSGVTFDPATKTISGTPTELGRFIVVVEGTGPSGSAVISFPWEITNLAPVVTVPNIPENLALFSHVSATAAVADPDGGPVSLDATNVPPGITFDPISGEFSGIPTQGGSYNVTVTATDDEGASTSGSFSWVVAPAVDNPIRINEVMASNGSVLLDEDGSTPDWVELVNTSDITIDMQGWTIADAGGSWTFPAISLTPGQYLVVFASDKDRAVPGQELHTNFKLSKEGDLLRLLRGDGVPIDEVDPLPLAFSDVSVGVGSNGGFGYLARPTPGAANGILGSDFVPVLRPFSHRLYNVGEQVNESIDGFDPDGTNLTYNASLPAGLTIDSDTGIITGTLTIAANWPRNIQIQDEDGREQTQPVNWYIIPAPVGPTALVMNEYNGVPGSGELAGGPDPAFTGLLGNGGDWFEFVVVEDGLDLRGWTIELWDRDNGDKMLSNSASLVFADDPALANLPAGLIITVSQDRPDDLSFDAAAGDWHINLQSATEAVLDANGVPVLDEDGDKVRQPLGAYFTVESQENFNSSRSNQNVIIRDENGDNRSPVVGETEAWDDMVGGLGASEVMNLCINPTTAQVDPLADYLDNAFTSTYGQPNQCTLVNDPADPDDDITFSQDLTALRDSAVLQGASVTSNCVGGLGVIRVTLTNSDGTPVDLDVTVTGLPTRTVSAAAGDTLTTFSGRADGLYGVTVERAGAVIGTFDQPIFCGAEATVDVECTDFNGRITVEVFNPTAQLAGYSAVIDGINKSKNVAGYDGDFLRVTGRVDGTYNIEVKRDATVVGTLTATVDCDPDIPAPDGVFPTVSCLAGNGRIDVNVLNRNGEATYELQVGELTPRIRTVADEDWWRGPVTGRADGPISVKLLRDGLVIMDTDLTVACDTPEPTVSSPEIRLLSVCRGGDGFLAWQFVNPTADTRSYLIEFEGVPNRSTTAAPFGAAVRGVSARPDGDYNIKITADGEVRENQVVTVACD